jgi:hypothetical protein
MSKRSHSKMTEPNSQCKYCRDTCGCGGAVSGASPFCCPSCERDYEGCQTMFPDAEDPVEAFFAYHREAP